MTEDCIAKKMDFYFLNRQYSFHIADLPALLIVPWKSPLTLFGKTFTVALKISNLT